MCCSSVKPGQVSDPFKVTLYKLLPCVCLLVLSPAVVLVDNGMSESADLLNACGVCP
jgi:hypothetical protein